MITRFSAIHSLVGGQLAGTDSEVEYVDGQTPPTEEAIQAKLTELQNAEPMRVLREERNWKLSDTDWMANSDVTMSDAWKKYRQDLRDLPASATPSLDEHGNLTNVTWPTKPS